MDVEIAGLNKVVCRTATANNGKVVEVTNGTNTWTATVASGIASFMIPSMPAPAKTSYTVKLHNGNASAAVAYSRKIELGFGDSIDITLDTAHEPATKGDISSAQQTLQQQITSLQGSLNTLAGRVTSVETKANNNATSIGSLNSSVSALNTWKGKLNAKTLVSASKSGSTLTLTSIQQ